MNQQPPSIATTFKRVLLAQKAIAEAAGCVMTRAVVGPNVWNALMADLSSRDADTWKRIDDVSFEFYGVRVSGLVSRPDGYPLFMIEGLKK